VAATEPKIAIVGGAGALSTEGLVWMLTKSGNRVVGAYPSFRALCIASRARELKLHAAIVDADDPAAGPAAVAEIRRAHPELKILLLCEVASPTVVRCAIDERAEGVVLKSDTVEEMILALRPHHSTPIIQTALLRGATAPKLTLQLVRLAFPLARAG
jgi:DNA-binding NarL/FixJ family response regulator